MSRTYDALKRAAAMAQRVPPPVLDEVGTEIQRVLDGSDQVEFQKVRVWLTGSAARGRPLKTVMVVGCHSGTGATTSAASLAATLAHGKKLKVVVVDVNFRTPKLGHVFNVRTSEGLFDVIEEGLSLDTGLQATERRNLSVLPTGRVSRYPAEVFEGAGVDAFIGELRRRFDFVVFDGAPLLEFPDSYALVPRVDGVILVVQAERTSIDDAQRAQRTIEEAGGRLLGAILNRQREYVPARLRKLLGAAA
jgi:capsular exopolysaccharide synthesis family protein